MSILEGEIKEIRGSGATLCDFLLDAELRKCSSKSILPKY